MTSSLWKSWTWEEACHRWYSWKKKLQRNDMWKVLGNVTKQLKLFILIIKNKWKYFLFIGVHLFSCHTRQVVTCYCYGVNWLQEISSLCPARLLNTTKIFELSPILPGTVSNYSAQGLQAMHCHKIVLHYELLMSQLNGVNKNFWNCHCN